MIKILLERKFLFSAIIFALIYLGVSIYFTNFQLLNQTIFGEYSLNYKIAILYSLILGLGSALSTTNLIFLIIISVLTGLNFGLLLKRLSFLPDKLPVHFAFGGSVLGVATTGCTSCGLPLLGILGFSGSLGYLPFKGLEVSILSVGLLLISFWYLLKNYQALCKIE